MNTQIIAIANQKGGVGKTTTCANLGIGLAQAGKKVLLIDGDPQGSLTISLGNPQPDKLPFTLSDAMGKILMDQPIRPGEGILHHAEGVDLMPADIQLSGMEVSLVNAMSRETVLRQYLDTLKGQYSHILIDCQPSLGMLTVNALAAANRIIIPVQAEYLPAKGLEQLYGKNSIKIGRLFARKGDDMSLKLEKIAAEREKARRKRSEWEERRKEWDRKYHEQENSEICEMVHAQSLTPEQLAVIIQMAQAAVSNPENLKLDEKETEDTDKIYAEQLETNMHPRTPPRWSLFASWIQKPSFPQLFLPTHSVLSPRWWLVLGCAFP